jgi:hypothetical protein
VYVFTCSTHHSWCTVLQQRRSAADEGRHVNCKQNCSIARAVMP